MLDEQEISSSFSQKKKQKLNDKSAKNSSNNTPTKVYIRRDKSQSRTGKDQNNKSISPNTNNLNVSNLSIKNPLINSNERDVSAFVFDSALNIIKITGNKSFNLTSTQIIEDEIKKKILYDSKGNIFPNIIEKKFRDGSKYIGQYNPTNNTK